MTRILITGSRDWTDRDAVGRALMQATTDTCGWMSADEHGNTLPNYGLVVVHGGATGADEAAGDWAISQCTVSIEVYPYPKGLGPLGGPHRSIYMVGLGADLCLAFIGPCTRPRCWDPQPHGSHGATECADLAEKHGIPTRRFQTWR